MRLKLNIGGNMPDYCGSCPHLVPKAISTDRGTKWEYECDLENEEDCPYEEKEDEDNKKN